MNRAARRREIRQTRREARYEASGHSEHAGWGDHMDCGCTVRRIVPAGPLTCPSCGKEPKHFDRNGVDFPTSSPVGAALKTEIGCSCGADYEVDFLVAS
jgi:hypothetical protein